MANQVKKLEKIKISTRWPRTFKKENVSELTNAVGELTCEQSDRYPFHTVRETYDRAFKEST